jgi:hypothetical protein
MKTSEEEIFIIEKNKINFNEPPIKLLDYQNSEIILDSFKLSNEYKIPEILIVNSVTESKSIQNFEKINHFISNNFGLEYIEQFKIYWNNIKIDTLNNDSKLSKL